MGHGLRLRPQYNREMTSESQKWSDGTTFTDGTGFLDGLLPPTAFVLAATARGETSIQIGGLPASISDALRRGDLLEFRPNGIADGVPRLHEVMVNGSTNSDGETGVEIRPALRSALVAGDMVVLQNPMSVFHLVDDSQGDVEMTVASQGSFGFSLVEAIENALMAPPLTARMAEALRERKPLALLAEIEHPDGTRGSGPASAR
jgi:hypothetical protein